MNLRMSDDFKRAKTTLAKFHKDMETINRLANPPYLSVIKQMMERIPRQHLEISRATLEIPGATARIKEIVSANQHLHKMIRQVPETSLIAKNLITVHQSWLENIKPIQHDLLQLSHLQASAKLALCDVSLQLVAAERFMAGVDFEVIRSRFQIEKPIVSGLESSITHSLASYGILAKSIREIPDITRLPAFVLPGATREIYTTSLALEALRPWDEREEEGAETEIQHLAEAELETSSCVVLLQEVDPELARPYIGAREALDGNNADRARHILVSLRELWNHLLRQLAPDDLVAAWIPGVANQKGLLHDGQPTRRARILYVCREIDNDPLTDFLIHDTRALVKLIGFFNRVHALETELTDEQLRAIVLKTDSWLMYILQISAGNFHN